MKSMHTESVQGSRFDWRGWVLILAGCFLAGSVAAQEDFSGVVTAVTDGDTLVVKPRARKAVKVRLAGVDAPESCQAGGVASRDALLRKLDHRTVQVEDNGRDAYGRVVGRVLLDGQDVGEWLVASGMAWNYRGSYTSQERQARAAKRGVHAQRNPVRPWDFRRDNGPCPATRASGSTGFPGTTTSTTTGRKPARDVDEFVVGTTSLTTIRQPSGSVSEFSTSGRTAQEERERRDRLERLRLEKERVERAERIRQERLRQDRLRRDGESLQFMPGNGFDEDGISNGTSGGTSGGTTGNRDRLRY